MPGRLRTGQSSLLNLTTFPVQDLKIDRTFISRIARGNTDSEVVRSLVALAHTLGLQVTAEGLETSEQWRLLEELGCDRAQGYYVGRPMAPGELLDCLEELERGSCRLAKSDTLLSEEPTLDNASRVFERPALGRA
jgi:EAL domain-containing protein (putative c-di-GMP-specific phosphodiesterase class I)